MKVGDVVLVPQVPLCPYIPECTNKFGVVREYKGSGMWAFSLQGQLWGFDEKDALLLTNLCPLELLAAGVIEHV
jgi:hypothetical protein